MIDVESSRTDWTVAILCRLLASIPLNGAPATLSSLGKLASSFDGAANQQNLAYFVIC